jgi:hypothetical protein
MSETSKDNLPPIVGGAVLSELMSLAALFVEHKDKNPALLTIKRIKMIAEGKPIQIFEPTKIIERLNTLLEAASRL